LIGGRFDVPLAYGFSLGPFVQIGVSDDNTLVGISGNVKYTISVPEAPKVLPSLEAGAVSLSPTNMMILKHLF